ncbi:hypothetical protein B6D60_10410 [candidate division KSB1 bacterium 4484_87]|nr:MAG: hypothetical protein B6D60_10410 [candidate division KSB1 bacterium 4484_87]
MRKYEIFYLIGILLIIFSLAYYFISSTPGVLAPDGTMANLTGEKGQVDSTIALDDAVSAFFEKERAEKRRLLWFTIPIGVLLLGAGVRIKRRIEGPDLFIDRDEDDEDF